MKRVLLLISLLAMPLARGQETPTAASLPEIVENYKILQGHVQDLSDANAALKRQIDDLQGKIDALAAQQAKPSGNYASQDDIKALKDAIQEVDKKRMADNDEVLKALKQMAKIGKLPASATTPTRSPVITPAPDTERTAEATRPEGPGFMYEVKPNDTPKKIARKLLEEKGIKITSDQILQANPQVKDPTKLFIGQKLFIPMPKTTTDTANN
jgi:LysM repeat protein